MLSDKAKAKRDELVAKYIADFDKNVMEEGLVLNYSNLEESYIAGFYAGHEFESKRSQELEAKLEKLLCHATGGLLSYSSYPIETMYQAVDEHVERCIERAKKEEEND